MTEGEGTAIQQKKMNKKKVAAPRFDRGTSGYHRKYGPCALYQLRHAACSISSTLGGYDRPSMPQSQSYPDKRSCRVVPPDPTLFFFKRQFEWCSCSRNEQRRSESFSVHAKRKNKSQTNSVPFVFLGLESTVLLLKKNEGKKKR